jgi:hypothetical protein
VPWYWGLIGVFGLHIANCPNMLDDIRKVDMAVVRRLIANSPWQNEILSKGSVIRVNGFSLLEPEYFKIVYVTDAAYHVVKLGKYGAISEDRVRVWSMRSVHTIFEFSVLSDLERIVIETAPLELYE